MRLFLSFLTNAIWIRIETNTLATTVATVGKSGNLPVASFEYTFDHVANVDEDDNGDDVGEDYMTQLLLLGKFEYTRGPIFKVVLEC